MARWQTGQKEQQAKGKEFRRQLAARKKLLQDHLARINKQMGWNAATLERAQQEEMG